MLRILPITVIIMGVECSVLVEFESDRIGVMEMLMIVFLVIKYTFYVIRNQQIFQWVK